MKNILLASVSIWLFCSSAHASELLQSCDDVIDNRDYQLLKDYFEKNNEAPERCQRLNNKEFIYTTDNNIFYCKSEKGLALACEATEQNTWFSNLTFMKRFTGKQDKQFVLFYTHLLSHGNSSDGFHVFYLVPKKVSPRGYKIFFFREAGAFDSNAGEGTCGNPNDNEVVTYLSPSVEIVNENRDDLIVRFNQKRINCKTNTQVRQTLEYTWLDFSFHKTQDKVENLPQGK